MCDTLHDDDAGRQTSAPFDPNPAETWPGKIRDDEPDLTPPERWRVPVSGLRRRSGDGAR